MIKGISSVEAASRLQQYGSNELPSAKPKNIRRIAAEVMKEPMFLLLIGSGTLYIILGDYREGMILLSTIFLVIGITFYQYRKTEQALKALKNLSSPRALVIRDGQQMRIAGREVVPGDIIILSEGDRVPADAEILETVNLSVDESLLTGESLPVSKSAAENNRSVFSGTLVVQGRGIAKVTTTGIHAQLGKIASSLKEIKEDSTRLQEEMKVLIRRLAVAGIFISISVVVLFYISRGNFIKSLLNGLAASMAILPEEFPVVLTVFLALGAWRLSRKNVLTRKSSAIETLGSATVLCSDKTGTITQNKMEVVALYDGQQIIYGEPYHEKAAGISELVRAAHLASHKDSFDPMERAIHQAYSRLFPGPETSLPLLKEYSLSAELMVMTCVYESRNREALSVFAKGAPEAIFSLCRMDEAEASKHFRGVRALAEKGYRVIGVARAGQKEKILPESQSGFAFEFNGLIGLEDPVRPEVPQAIRECYDAGINVIMITGDFPATAKSIALQAGFAAGEIISGEELKRISDEELKNRIRNVNIFARVAHEQKVRIVQALKGSGEIVAMTGDGVNDAPALKAAHIGVAMGNKGTDVAREVSSLVLVDDNFASIVSAIRLGRKIFDNLQKAMSYILAIHIPIIGLTMLPAFATSLPLLLMPLHIVFMELIIDPVCSIAFESEQEEKGIMNRPPRSRDEKFFGLRQITFSIFQGMLLLTMVLTVYFLSIHEGHTGSEVRTIAFTALIIGNIFLILTTLSKTRSFISVFAEKNVAAILILSSAFILLLLAVSVPALQQVFNFGFPGYRHFISSVAGASIMLAILEGIKYYKSRKGLKFVA